jgi:glyoxylase I family protein
VIRGIHHVAIHTKNLDRILAFYREAFGFVPVIDELSWSDNKFFDSVIGLSGTAGRLIMLKANNVYLEIFEYSAPPGRQGEPLHPNDHGYTHFCVDSDDIEEDYKRLVAAGAKFTRAVPDEVTGIRAVYGQDPDGNVIELQQVVADHAFSFERLRRQHPSQS